MCTPRNTNVSLYVLKQHAHYFYLLLVYINYLQIYTNKVFILVQLSNMNIKTQKNGLKVAGIVRMKSSKEDIIIINKLKERNTN